MASARGVRGVEAGVVQLAGVGPAVDVAEVVGEGYQVRGAGVATGNSLQEDGGAGDGDQAR